MRWLVIRRWLVGKSSVGSSHEVYLIIPALLGGCKTGKRGCAIQERNLFLYVTSTACMPVTQYRGTAFEGACQATRFIAHAAATSSLACAFHSLQPGVDGPVHPEYLELHVDVNHTTPATPLQLSPAVRRHPHPA